MKFTYSTSRLVGAMMVQNFHFLDPILTENLQIFLYFYLIIFTNI
jgi:hypothetical protein